MSGRRQTVNETNNFHEMVIDACKEACRCDGNAALLNTSTDGVSCQVKSNLTINVGYLDGKCNDLVLTDTNHNAKNNQYQLIGGSSATRLCFWCISDVLLFKQNYLETLSTGFFRSVEHICYCNLTDDTSVPTLCHEF
eukprot:15329948-Ditylum_brightwellii.AAC.2